MDASNKLNDILIFKTNIRYKKDLETVTSLLNEEEKILQWNVARDDSDRVLRVKSQHLYPQDVISLLKRAGFFCEELPD